MKLMIMRLMQRYLMSKIILLQKMTCSLKWLSFGLTPWVLGAWVFAIIFSNWVAIRYY